MTTFAELGFENTGLIFYVDVLVFLTKVGILNYESNMNSA